jgi:CubicO group peptidase (beta-lactamase class C family)
MFLRRPNRRKDGKDHRYFSVVENRRLPGGKTAQRTVLYLGEINDRQQAAWRKTLDVFDEAEQRFTSMSLFPDEHREGPYFDRCPGRGFGYTLSVRTEPMPGGPSVGAFNWNGTTGVWFLIDRSKETIVLLTVQHPTSGKNAKTGVPYISKIEENNRYQAAVYADLAEL